jgi:superfamily II RNA helicase
LAGLAEQWAAGCGWHAVKESVPIDEGDIVKILHRTQDMLRQFASLSHVPSELTKTARIASDLFERSPLTDA